MTSPDYGAIIKRSWSLTWKNKWLWVYGLVLGALGAGGSFGGGGGSGGSSSSKTEVPADLPEKTSKALGQATDAVSAWFSTVPVTSWILLAFGLLVLIVFIFVVNLIVQSWAKGALIWGIDEASEGKEVRLKESSAKGLAAVKHLIIFGLISGLVVIGMIMIFVVLLGIGAVVFSFSKPVMIIWMVIVGVVGGLGLFVGLIITGMIGIYAERLIVLREVKPWDAWKRGLSLSRKSFLPTVVMGIINMAISCSVGCLSLVGLGIVVGIPALILVLPIFAIGFSALSVPLVLGLIALVFLAFSLNLLIRAVLVVFNFSNWNLLFEEVIREEKNE